MVLTGACLALMAQSVGWVPASCGCGVVVASVLVQIWLGKRFKVLRTRTAECTDARETLISEILNGMSTVKCARWEQPFSKLVQKLRAAEARSVLLSQRCKALTAGMYFCTVAVASCATFAAYSLGGSGVRGRGAGEKLTVASAAATVALLNSLKMVVGFGCAYFFMAVPEALVAARRMQHFLQLDEVAPGASPLRGCDERAADVADDSLLRLEDASFEWPSSSSSSSSSEREEEEKTSSQDTPAHNRHLERKPRPRAFLFELATCDDEIERYVSGVPRRRRGSRCAASRSRSRRARSPWSPAPSAPARRRSSRRSSASPPRRVCLRVSLCVSLVGAKRARFV